LARDAGPVSARLDGAATDILSVIENWALAIQTRDGVGHLFRVSLSLTPEILRQLGTYIKGAPSPVHQQHGSGPTFPNTAKTLLDYLLAR
jgi:hypothetical protein